MAYHHKNFVFLTIVLAILVSGISGNLLCEDLPVDLCTFSVSSTGSRCVLEKRITTNGHVKYECLTSQVSANEYAEWVETDECVQACGLERMSVGISSDALVERGFAKSLCSSSCQDNCPNVVDLFSNLATGEGVSLKRVCDAQAKVARREMVEVSFASLSTSTASAWELAQGPSSSPSLFAAPPPSFAPSPSFM